MGDSTAAHPASQQHMGSVPLDKRWHLAGGMASIVGIVDTFNGRDGLPLNVDEHETGTAAKVTAHQAV